jgi:predicted HD phosphohydrolase
MQHGTAEEYALLVEYHQRNAATLADRVLALFAELDHFETGYRIDRRRHSLQSATRAWRDGADTGWVIAALLHDLGDHLAPYSDGLLPAAILQPFVREQCSRTVAHHTSFQLYYYGHLIGADRHAREAWRDHPYFDDCAAFCERWDLCSFDPAYTDEPLDFFKPMLREVFARIPNEAGVVRVGEREPLCNATLAGERGIP